MREPDLDTLMFFDAHREVLEVYLTFEERLRSAFPNAKRRVQKTQITFYDRCVFACVSFARVKRRAELPEGWLVITLGLPCPLDSGRVAAKTEPYPGRWTHHFVVSRPEELDAEFMGWVRESWDFAQIKRGGGKRA